MLRKVILPPPYFPLQNNLIDFTKNAPKAVSLGVSPYSPWDLDMANIGYKVLQYDASINKPPYKHPNITFHKKFVGVKNSDSVISFERLITQNDLNKNECNVLQCDIEDCEWEILEQLDLGILSEIFPQILFEFHNCNPESEALSVPRLAILERIKSHYTPIHTHFNNHGAIFYANGYFWGDTVEVSYLRNDLVRGDAVLLKGVGNLNADAPNAKGYPDIPVIF